MAGRPIFTIELSSVVIKPLRAARMRIAHLFTDSYSALAAACMAVICSVLTTDFAQSSDPLFATTSDVLCTFLQLSSYIFSLLNDQGATLLTYYKKKKPTILCRYTRLAVKTFS